MKEKPIALIDMDGTVADYDGQLARDMNLIASPGEKPFESLGWKRDEFPAYIQERMRLIKAQDMWWEKIPVLPSGMHIVRILETMGFNLHVLTQGPKRNANAWSQKTKWVLKNLPMETPITITRDKGLVYGKILVDDWPEYVERWLRWRPRGKVIMVAHPWNEDFKHPNAIRYRGAIDEELLIKTISEAKESQEQQE